MNVSAKTRNWLFRQVHPRSSLECSSLGPLLNPLTFEKLEMYDNTVIIKHYTERNENVKEMEH
jgi:hypothetical protein